MSENFQGMPPAYVPIPEEFYKSNLIKMSKSMNFLGIMSIIGGAFSCLSIIGAAFGIPMIFAGMRLKESAEYFKNFVNFDDPGLLAQALMKQERYFYIQMIITIVSLALVALYIIFLVAMIAFMGASIFNKANSF